MRRVGLHIRKYSSLVDLAQKAMRMGVRIIQCFVVKQYTSTMITPSPKDIKDFLALREQYFDALFLHGSYWINLASLKHTGYDAFKRELNLAKKLQFTDMIVHPGTAKGAQTRSEGIAQLARMLNRILKQEHGVRIVLENTAHAGMAVGSDINDFFELRQLLDKPEQISFCIDTSHAYAYGYDIATVEGQETFIALLDKAIGIENIIIIHLNDTKERCGSHIDRHAVLGDGKIGFEALKTFVTHPRLNHIPLLFELPAISEDKEMALLELVRSWS